MSIHDLPLPAPPGHRLRWLVVLMAGVICYWLVLFTMIVTRNLVLFPTLLLVGALCMPLAVLAWANWRGPVAIVGGVTIPAVAASSGVVGVLLASVLEAELSRWHLAWPMLGVALIEESVKMIVPIILLLAGVAARREAGVVIGVAAGTGFAVLETMGYGFTVLLRTSSLAAVDQTLLLRGVFAPACHIAWTGMLAAACWHARHSRHRAGGVVAAVGTFVAVVLLHASWDTLPGAAPHVLVALVSVGGLLLACRGGGRHA